MEFAETIDTAPPGTTDPPKKRKLYDALHRDGVYTKSFEEFESQFSTPEKIGSLYSALSRDGLVTVDDSTFRSRYFGDGGGENVGEKNVGDRSLEGRSLGGPSPLSPPEEGKDGVMSIAGKFSKGLDALQAAGGESNQGRVMEAANRFSEGFVRPLSVDILRSFAVGGTKVSNALGLTDEMAVEDSPVYRFAEDLSKDIDVLFPQNKKYQDEFLARQFPEGLGSAASFMVGGAASKTAKIPAMASSVVLGSSTIAANEFVNAKDAGASDEEAFNVFLLNLPLGATEAIPLGKMMRRLDKVSGGKFTGILSRKLTNKYAKMGAEALAGGVEEAFQETILQQLPSNIVAGQTYDETKNLYEGLVEGGTTGFAVGLTLNALGLGVANMRSKATTPEEIAELQKIEEFLDEKSAELQSEEVQSEENVGGEDVGVENVEDLPRPTGTPSEGGKEPSPLSPPAEGKSEGTPPAGEPAPPPKGDTDTGGVIEGEVVPEIGFSFDPEADVETQRAQLNAEFLRLMGIKDQFLDNESVVKDIDLALDDITRIESELGSEENVGVENVGVQEGDSSTEALDVSNEVVEPELQSTQFNIPDGDKQPILDFVDSIPESELYTEEGKDQYGKETEPHVTALYGLTEDVTPEQVQELTAEFGDIELELGSTSIFENENYDVLKVDVEGADLRKLNKVLSKLPNENKFPDYKPHMTIAYLKPGEGKKYVGDDRFKGQKITASELLFSDVDRNKKAIPLGKVGFGISNTEQGITSDEVVEEDSSSESASEEEVTELQSDKDVSIVGTFDALRKNNAPKISYVDKYGRERTTFDPEYRRDYFEKSDETNQPIRYGVQLSDGRLVSLDGAIRITDPKRWEKVERIMEGKSQSEKNRILLQETFTDDQITELVNNEVDEFLESGGDRSKITGSVGEGSFTEWLKDNGSILSGLNNRKAFKLKTGELVDLPSRIGLKVEETAVPSPLSPAMEGKDLVDNELLGDVSENFRSMPIAEIKTDVDRFQNRERAFSEETASSIVEDVNAGVLNPDNIPPILVWEDPTNGETYVVGGHSRIEAFKRLKLPSIPTQVLKGISEEQAIERGRTDNALGTQETITEQANLLRDDVLELRKQNVGGRSSGVQEGKTSPAGEPAPPPKGELSEASSTISKASIERKAKRLFKKNYRDVMALAALNPTGKAIQTVQALEKNQSDDKTRVQTYAKYIGEARLKHQGLTDSHETELFDYLVKHDNSKTKNQKSFIAFVDDLVGRNSFMGDFDASKPLNAKEAKPKTPEEIAHEAITKELDKEVKDARTNLQKRIKEIEQRKLAGETINEDAAEKSIKRFQDNLKVAERRLLEHKLKQGEVEQTKRSQGSFFGDRMPRKQNVGVRSSGVQNSGEPSPLSPPVEGKVQSEGFGGEFEGGSNPLNVDRKLAEAKQIEVVDEYGRQREITLGELENITGLELPELVTFTRELTGNAPSISTRFTSTRGVFYPVGDGKIALKASIFKDTKLASQVLAHEIGHLIDYLPEQTMSRGNILGRLLTLRKYLKTTAEGSQSRGEALTTKDRAKLRRMAEKAVIDESGVTLQEYINDKDLKASLSDGIKERYQEYVQREIDNRGLLDNKALFNELYAHSKAWRPFEESEVDEDFLMYRRSSAELYADALSALLVSPGTLQKNAPTFYAEFFEQLDNKPEVKTQFIELQALLTGGRERLLRLRNETINQAYYKAEDLNRALIEERENAKQSFVDSFKQSIVNKYHPIIKKVNEAKLAGKTIRAEEDPTYLLEELDYKDNVTTSYLYDVGEQVAKPIEDAGMTTLELHKFLLFNRIVNEGRSDKGSELQSDKVQSDKVPSDRVENVEGRSSGVEDFLRASDEALDAEKKKYGRAYMANPGGLTSEASQELLDNMRMELGSEQFELLEQAARRFQELNFEFVEQAVEVGVYSREIFEKIIEPNKYNYATFRVLDYIQYPDYVTSAIQESSGTLKDVGSTFDATLLKTVALIQTNAINRAKRGVRDTWANHFSGEISKAKYLGDGKFAKEPGLEHLFVLENGQRVAYNVDPYIAKVFDYTNPKMLNWFVKLVRTSNESIYRPLFITYNPAFVFWSNPIRDFKRLYRNLPEGSLVRVLKGYIDNWQTAKAYSKGEISNPKIRKLIDDFAITPPGEGLVFKDRGDALGRQMERFHLIDGQKNWVQKQLEKNKVVQWMPKLLANIRQKGSMLEILPKLVANDVLEAEGVSKEQRSYRIRNHFGTPNFKAGGADKNFTNSIYMFSNIMVQGYKADIEVATSPGTRGAFWLRFAMLDLLPKLLVRGALLGWMGKELQEFYDRVTEYDKTNYTVIPLGWKGEGTNKEAVYLRVPQDESARLMSSVIWKLTGVLAEDNRADWNGVFDLGADELPGPSPVLVTLSKWAQYLGGSNPKDDWRDRPILPTRVHNARKENSIPALKKMVQWTVNQTGVTSLVTYNEHAESWDEVILQTTPILNRMIKSTNYGLNEKQSEEQNLKDAKDNARRLEYGDDVLRMISSTYYLRKLGDARTTDQEIEYEYYNNFYQQVYRPYDELIQQYMEMGDDEAAKDAISSMKEFAAEYKTMIEEAN